MKPQDILLKHEDLIKLVIEHGYLPHASQGNFNEVLGALRAIDPRSKYDPSCSGCVPDIIRTANAHLQAYKKTLPVYHTFPSHEKNKKAT